MNAENVLTAHVITKPDSLDQAISIFEQQGFELMRRQENRFSIKGILSLHQEKLGYIPETNTGNVPDWAQESVTGIIYPVKPKYYNPVGTRY